jgi:membrane-bound lytic murein transglycosylase F
MNLKRALQISCQLIIIFSLFTFGCGDKANEKDEDKTTTLDIIKQRNKLIALTDYNSINYFIYRGTTMGFQYELLHELAKHMGVDIEIKVLEELEEGFTKLSNRSCDIIALNLTITKARNKRVLFTEPILQTHQVLVQKKPANWHSLTKKEINLKVIRNQLNLAKKTVFVQVNSSHAERLKNLSEEIGNAINIKEVPMTVEELIKLVAEGKIDYTVCDENVAKVNQTYYPNIDIQTAISFPQYIAWAVGYDSEELQQAINTWLVKFKKSLKYQLIYNKYFKNKKSIIRMKSDYYSISSGKISPYDDIIKRYSDLIGWDWRLLTAMIYQESRFNPNVRSWAGAFGLAQLMPATASRYNVTFNSSVEAQLRASFRFLRYLDSKLKNRIKDPEERKKFVLASYNVGLGHVMDARRLARKYGKDPTIWDEHVAFFILNKSKPAFYKDPVVRYGYCRGEEPFNYVKDILDRFEHYKNIVKSVEN